MSFDFSDVLDELDESVFEEKPVSIKEFCSSKDYLGLPKLSDLQLQVIMASTQIFREETLFEYLTPSEAKIRMSQTYSEVVMQLAKGSGKDFCSTVACLYIVYQLLCLKDPQEYFGKPPGDYIDIMNIAANAVQAKNVFFGGLKMRLKNSPWFRGKYTEKSDEINFNKSVRLISGHSQFEGMEGYNVIAVFLDEVSAFDEEGTNSTKKITAQATYDMHKASVISRFGRDGKLVLLSFPRSKTCFISKRYNEVVEEKETIMKSHVYVIDPSQDARVPGNTLEIEWEEDHIRKYKTDGVFALRRPSWDCNPTKSIEDYKSFFVENPVEAYRRFACMPPDEVGAFFKDRQKIEKAFSGANGVDEDGVFYDWFLPDENKTYFIHTDLSIKHDRCVVTMSHVEKWVGEENAFNRIENGIKPYVVVDAVRYWTPRSDKEINFAEVRDYILSLRDRGFNIKLATLDRWRSEDFIKYLNSVGIKSEVLSASNQQYYAMAALFSEERVVIPRIQLAIEEYLKLRVDKNGKVNHTSKNSDDLAVCIAGSVYNAVKNTVRDTFGEIEIKTYRDYHRPVPNTSVEDETVIRAPKSTKYAQSEMMDYLSQLKLI